MVDIGHVVLNLSAMLVKEGNVETNDNLPVTEPDLGPRDLLGHAAI